MKYMLKISDNTYLNLNLDGYEDGLLFNAVVDTLLNARVYKRWSETFTKADSVLSPKIELVVVPDNRLKSQDEPEGKEE